MAHYEVYSIQCVSLDKVAADCKEYAAWREYLRDQCFTEQLASVLDVFYATPGDKFPEMKSWLRGAPKVNLLLNP